MRVIAGSYKGRRLLTARGNWLRPTADRTREFIFSFLGNQIPGVEALDLFAGTGSLGIEAIGRGARTVSFVEVSDQAIMVLKRNLSALGIQADVFKREARSFLHETRRTFDIIFADPPYHYSDFTAILQTIRVRKVLLPSGLVVFETSSRNEPLTVDGFQVVKEKRLGDTQINFHKVIYENRANGHLSGII